MDNTITNLVTQRNSTHTQTLAHTDNSIKSSNKFVFKFPG